MNIRACFAVLASLAFASVASAHEGHVHTQATGTVNAVNVEHHKVNISHKAIPELGWPAMTMDFPVVLAVDLKSIKPGTQVDFELEKNKAGTYEVHAITPVSAK